MAQDSNQSRGQSLWRSMSGLPGTPALCVTTLQLVVLALLLVTVPCVASGEGKSLPGLLLSDIYDPGIDLSEYWVSEKFDGVRAYWDGRQLVSRQGNVFHAPDWFIGEFPDCHLDGELWMGRGTFQKLSGVVRKQSPIDAEWRRVRYLVFDLPESPEVFDDRLASLRTTVKSSLSPYLQLVEQRRVPDHDALMRWLRDLERGGGEGLMLHRGGSYYRAGRSGDLLKLKSYRDDEARVVGHIAGKGRLQGMLGSLVAERADGQRFRIGTGFSDAERREPPPIGSVVTYKYYGLTNAGLPRHATFLRMHKTH